MSVRILHGLISSNYLHLKTSDLTIIISHVSFQGDWERTVQPTTRPSGVRMIPCKRECLPPGAPHWFIHRCSSSRRHLVNTTGGWPRPDRPITFIEKGKLLAVESVCRWRDRTRAPWGDGDVIVTSREDNDHWQIATDAVIIPPSPWWWMAS